MPIPADPAALAAALEVTFDGRSYRFRGFRYEALDDALRYARAQRALPGFAPDPTFRAQWLAAWSPTAAEQGRIDALGIRHEGGRFVFGPWRYDRLEDAVAYAERGPLARDR